MTCVASIHSAQDCSSNAVPIGRHSSASLDLDLNRLLAGRMLLQGGSGAGKSRTMRRIVEEAFDYVQTMIADPEGEFGNLAEHIGAPTLRGAEIAADGLTAAAARARHHRIALHLESAHPSLCHLHLLHCTAMQNLHVRVLPPRLL